MPGKKVTLTQQFETESSPKFLQEMVNRMDLSRLKYGLVADAYPHKISAIVSLLVRLERYLGKDRFLEVLEGARQKASTGRRLAGNTEFLVDAANFCMIEYMHPSVDNAHFEATDSDQSPGRASVQGTVSQEANTLSMENIRRGGSNRTTSGGFYKNEGD